MFYTIVIMTEGGVQMLISDWVREKPTLTILICLFLIALLDIWILVDSEKEKGNKMEEEG